MSEIRPILLVEDSPRDLELTLTALEKCQLANEIIVARDGTGRLWLYLGQSKRGPSGAGRVQIGNGW